MARSFMIGSASVPRERCVQGRASNGGSIPAAGVAEYRFRRTKWRCSTKVQRTRPTASAPGNLVREVDPLHASRAVGASAMDRRRTGNGRVFVGSDDRVGRLCYFFLDRLAPRCAEELSSAGRTWRLGWCGSSWGRTAGARLRAERYGVPRRGGRAGARGGGRSCAAETSISKARVEGADKEQSRGGGNGERVRVSSGGLQSQGVGVGAGDGKPLGRGRRLAERDEQ